MRGQSVKIDYNKSFVSQNLAPLLLGRTGKVTSQTDLHSSLSSVIIAGTHLYHCPAPKELRWTFYYFYLRFKKEC